MLKRRFSLSLLAILVVLSLVFQGTMVLAGTTGGLSGTVLDSTSKQPLAGVKVTAASPQQIVSATTDGEGHFSFLNLAPDTYTVSVEAQGYQANTLAGVTITADNTRVVAVNVDKQLKTIGRVTTRSNGALVKPGTTADVYSINPTVQTKVAAAGGGGNLNSAFSAMATVPGVTVAPGTSGYVVGGLSIRGGDYDQIGYEIDGVPVNRAFDNYPSGPTSSLGQQELQVYTGAPPANASSQGISGYVNQVIKTGTFPAFGSIDVGDGGPAYYHKLSVEYGGTTTDKRFAYYFALGGYDQEYRYGDQYQGNGIGQLYGTPAAVSCTGVSITVSPGCYNNGVNNGANGLVQLPFDTFLTSNVADRDSDVNLHYYFPHKDGSRDDLQALYQYNYIDSQFFSSNNDLGGVAFLNASGIGASNYVDGYNLNLPTGGFLPSNYKSLTSIYYAPNTPVHSFQAPIQADLRDSISNNQAIEKLQFTKSLGSNAYFRVYGYSYYSNWLQTGPNATTQQFYANAGTSPDYELSAHTRGVSFTLADQLNAQNLLSLEGDYTTSTVVRDNNTQMENGLSGTNDVTNRTAIGVLVNSKTPTNGICYNGNGVATNCFSSPTGYNGDIGGAQFATIGQAYNGTIAPITAAACGTGPCQYLVVGNGQYATYNEVKPEFYGASLTDEFRPNSKLTINGGLRLDDYQYVGSDTSGGNARAFWYAAYNREMCLNPATQLVETKASLGLVATQSCTAGAAINTNFLNPTGAVTQTYPVFQPRLGATYSVDPNTVLRASYGRYAEPPNSAYEQYNFLQSNAPLALYGTYGFQQYGYNTPDHPIPPAASNNYDFSVEHQFPGQLSLKLTPFLRKTQNQSEEFFLNRATDFVSGLNVGNQTSEGVEFEVDKGDFAREGLAAKLAFAYTHSYIKYNTLSNGTTVLTPVVNAIKAYNALTKQGGGAACYTLVNATTGAGGTAAPGCGAGTIANPYYNAPEQDLAPYNAGAISIPYSTIPAGVGLDSTQIGVPFTTSLVLNEKIKKLSFTPVVQYFAGQRYGNPEATAGIDPTTCTGALTTAANGDPRYQFGAQAGVGYNAADCGQLDSIPNLQTGTFDGIGAFVEPSQLLLHLQVAYEVAKNVTLTANLSNIVNTCFGGTKVPWAVAGACSYTLTNAGLTGGVGNTYNPGQAIQPSGQYSYGPSFSQQPFGIYVDANIKM